VPQASLRVGLPAHGDAFFLPHPLMFKDKANR
jgi:hypothetical protein